MSADENDADELNHSTLSFHSFNQTLIQSESVLVQLILLLKNQRTSHTL